MPASRTEAFAENGRRNLTLIFTGDLMQHMPQVFAARQRDGSFDYTSCFSRLNNYFSSADFVIANLETTLGEEPYSGYPRFRSPEALAGAMRRAGVDVAVLANITFAIGERREYARRWLHSMRPGCSIRAPSPTAFRRARGIL